MKLFRRVVLATTLAAAPALAQQAPVHLSFAAYFSGLNVADMQAQVAIAPQGYHLQLSYQMTGVLGALFSGEGSSTVDGRFAGDRALPRELFSRGTMGGKWRVTQIDWQGDHPQITQLQPPLEPERDPVPPADQANTIDGLSAIVVLLHRVWTTGRCDGDARTYEGRWLSDIAARTVGEEALDPTSRSPFQGTALRCDIEGQQLAGFFHDRDEATRHKPHRASVWFARMAPGAALVPVRIAIETGRFGSATLYITGVS